MNKKLPQAMIVGKDIRCPVCGRKWGEIHGAGEIIKNYAYANIMAHAIRLL